MFGCGRQGTTNSQPAAVIPASQPGPVSPNSQNLDVDLTSSHAINSATITISNRGSASVVMPSVFSKGSTGLDRDSILYFIRHSAALSDEQFALATWNFVIQHNQHYCSAGAPGDPGNYADDPMRLLNAFGFSCCDESADLLAWLWIGAGYTIRIARMTFHTVPEIFYQGRWHAYDPDHKVYYLDLDDKTVASVADLIADPDLVARVADANGNDPVGYSTVWMAAQYAAAVPSYDHRPPSYETTWSLASNQSFTLRSENVTPSVFYHPTPGAWQLFPDSVNSGQFEWDLDFARPDWFALTNWTEGVTTLSNSAGTFLTNARTYPGYAIYRLSSPFPVFTLSVSGLVFREDPAAAVTVSVLNDGSSNWSAGSPLNAEPGSLTQATLDLTGVAVGQYSYFVMIRLSGRTAQAARVAALHITSDVQVAKMVFPNLTPGTINHLIYQDWSPSVDTHSVDISVNVR
jgi:hypothetical protein